MFKTIVVICLLITVMGLDVIKFNLLKVNKIDLKVNKEL